MLRNCDNENLLKAKIVDVNGEKIISYFKKNKSLESVINFKITAELVKEIINNLVKLQVDLGQYLLNVNDILISSEYIFIDEKNFRFIYLPNYNEDFYSQLIELFKQILNNLDYKDKELTSLIFAVHKMLEYGNDLISINEYILNINKKNNEDIDEYIVEIKNEINESDTNLNSDENHSIVDKYKLKRILIVVVSVTILLFLLTNLEQDYMAMIISFIMIIIFGAYKYDDINEWVNKKININQDKQISDKNKKIILFGETNIIIDKFPFILGNDIEDDYVIADKNIHIKFISKSNKIYMKNFSKVENIYLNEKKIRKMEAIGDGDILQIGNRIFNIKN